MLRAYIQLMRLDKPIGILLLLWPTLWALWLASNGIPDLKILFIFIAGVVTMRTAGCIINDFADRNFDKYVQRTANRPLTTGVIAPKKALVLFFCLLTFAFILVLQLNRLTILLSLGGLFLAVLYPFTKRFLHCPQLILGFAFAWGVPMAFSALLNDIPPVAWWLFSAAVLWPIAYDTQYAMADREDDKKIGIKSSAIWFGRYDRFAIALLQGGVLILLIVVGVLKELNVICFFSLAVAFLLMLYQQYLMKDREAISCFKAFLNNHWIGLVIFLGIFVMRRFI